MSTKLSQHAKILRELKNSKRGVPNYRFPQMGILSYTRRIFELKRDGHAILKERQYINGHATGVYLYYLADVLENYPLQYEDVKPKNLIERMLHL